MNWWSARRRQARCMHGTPAGGSFVRGRIVDLGQRKLWVCRPEFGGCGRRWMA